MQKETAVLSTWSERQFNLTVCKITFN